MEKQKSKAFQFKSIQMKIILPTAILFLATIAILLIYSSTKLYNVSLEASKDLIQSYSEAKAGIVKAEVELALDAARTLAQSMEAIKDPDYPLEISRDGVNAMLRRVLIDNPGFLGVYTLWEPNALDGKDAEFASTYGYDETGRLIPYWVRSEGKIIMEPLVDYEIEGFGDYYQIPKRTMSETILNPYIYKVEGKDVLITSVVVPIIVGDKFFGIAGVDLSLEFIQGLTNIDDINLAGSELLILSNDGTIAGFSNNADQIGQHMRNYREDWQSDITYIQEGKNIIEEDEGNFAVYSGVKIGSTLTPWSINLNVPISSATESARRARLTMLIIGGVSGAIALVVLWLYIGMITRPIKLVSDIADKIAEGDINQNIQIKQSDEVGQLANAFERMIAYLKELAGIATQLADNDFSAKVNPRSENDILSKAFELMTSNIRSALSEISDSAMKLSAASNQIADASGQAGNATNQITTTIQQIAIGTSQQAEASNSTAASVEELNRAVDGVAKGAQEQAASINRISEKTAQISESTRMVIEKTREVTRQAGEAAGLSKEGYRQVDETVSGMKAIKEKVSESANAVKEMGKRSEQIGIIVETIHDIASQTNLLALNAAIEAARAGEHGKGFAVVADEVRQLAERSSQATREITDLIKGIQTASAQAVAAMNDSGLEVENGVEKVGKAGYALNRILEASEKVNQQAAQVDAAAMQMSEAADDLVSSMDTVSAIVEENTAATEEMTAGFGEVAEAFESIASVSEENSASVEEVSASTEEMSAQVEELVAATQELANISDNLAGLVTNFNLGSVSEMDQIISLSKNAHQKWVERLHEMNSGNLHLEYSELVDHHNCILGKWCDKTGAANFSDLPIFSDLQDTHKVFHEKVKQAVEAYNQGDMNKSKRLTLEVENLSKKIVEDISVLEKSVN
jgi:methyl-accepting chemotaxis protein